MENDDSLVFIVLLVVVGLFIFGLTLGDKFAKAGVEDYSLMESHCASIQKEMKVNTDNWVIECK